jgi:integrase
MPQKLTDKNIKLLPTPERGNQITYDTDVKGFGVRITAAGGRAFVLNYRRRSDGVERRYTIGSVPEWNVAAAREEAKRLKRDIDGGSDPVGEHKELRDAPTVADLCDRFQEEHLPRKRASTQADYRSIIRGHIRPALGKRKVAALTFDDVDALHRAITKEGSPYRANRTVAILSKMLSLAVQWRLRSDNPAKGIERNDEAKRRRYLSNEELLRLLSAFAAHDDQQAANIFGLLLLTGARRGEVLGAKWADIDIENGVWTKPGATTKQRTEHRVPLSAPARQLLAGIERTDSPYVFPGRTGGHRAEVKGNWARICKAADITGLRIHDLRHSYASQLASAGVGLHVIGALLGHTQPQTTHRYAHLFDDPLRQATERVGAILSGKPSGEVVPLKAVP